jgi:uncharacterized protein YlxW (UPF0749 family)
MAEEYDKQAAEAEIRRATWRSIAIGALWIALVVGGIVFERLGVTTGLLSSVLPGEVQALRQQIGEERTSLSSLTSERDKIKVQLDQLRKARESYRQCNDRLEELQEDRS